MLLLKQTEIGEAVIQRLQSDPVVSETKLLLDQQSDPEAPVAIDLIVVFNDLFPTSRMICESTWKTTLDFLRILKLK